MALSQYWLSKNRKDLAERAIIAKRELDAQNAERRESAARYHRDLNRLSSQYRNLEESQPGKTPRVNQESILEEEAKARRKERLYQRQQKLMLLLAKENEQYLQKLKAINDEESEKDPWNIAKLKEQIEELRKRREQDEELLRKKNMYHLFHQGSVPFVKEHEASLLKKDVFNAWEKQKKDIEMQSVKRSEEIKQKIQELTEQRSKARQEADDTVAELENARTRWTEAFEKITERITDINILSDKQSAELEILSQHRKLIEDVLKKRREVNDIHKQREKKLLMFRCSKEKVRRMSAEVRHILERDLTTLMLLNQLDGKEKDVNTGLTMEGIKEAKDWTANFIAREVKRDSEVQAMFEEEASKLWNSRKQTWDKEMESHEKLIADMFQDLQTQVEKKISQSLTCQHEHLGSRQKLLNDISEQNGKSEREERELLGKRDYFLSRIKELDEQIVKLSEPERPPPKLLKK